MPQRKPPPDARSGPQSPTGNRPSEITSAAAQQGTAPASIVSRPARTRKAKPVAPLAAASVFGPVGRRTCWWYTYRCGACGAHLFGRAKSLDAVTGERRAGCGHRVRVMAARVYSQPGVAA